MKRLLQLCSGGLLAVGIVLVGAPGTAAQEAPSRADLNRMHDEAMAPAAHGDLHTAMLRHGQVAYLRRADDPRRFDCLRSQAHLLHSVGEIAASVFYLEEAGEQALETGDPFDAAMTFIDAAIVAKSSGDRPRAVALGLRARDLLSSSSLDVRQRATLRGRLGVDG